MCHGFSRSVLIVNGEYRRPWDSIPDHSGRGDHHPRLRLRVLELDPIPFPRRREIASALTPVRASSDRNPSTASRPFVVPDSARIASHAYSTRSSDGRPSAIPPRTVPFFARELLDLVAAASTRRP